MPRKKRLTVTGALHHIMARCIDSQVLFADDNDREHFLGLLATCLRKTRYQCLAWALMKNHYHILVRANELPLSCLMRPLNTNYARHHGKRHKRRGYLFQDRFKSIATQDQDYIEELVRYIHLNPIRAGILRTVEQLDRYPWTGHCVLMGNATRSFQQTNQVLRRFGKNRHKAQQQYRDFLMKGLDCAEDDSLIDSIRKSNRDTENRFDYGCWVIGDREFVVRAFADDENRRLRVAQCIRDGWNIERLEAYITKHTGVNPHDMQRRGRLDERSACRKLFAYLGVRKLGISASDIANYFAVSTTAVSKLARNGEEEFAGRFAGFPGDA